MGYSSKAIICTENRFRRFTRFGIPTSNHICTYKYVSYESSNQFQQIQEGEILLGFFFLLKKTNRKSFDVHWEMKCSEEYEWYGSCAIHSVLISTGGYNFKNERKTCCTFIHNTLNTTWTFPIAFSKTWYTQS